MRKMCESTDFVNFLFAANIKSGSMNDKEGQRLYFLDSINRHMYNNRRHKLKD